MEKKEVMKIYILSPANGKTGGIELLHQMCHVINNYTMIEAKIAYVDTHKDVAIDNICVDAVPPMEYLVYKTTNATSFAEIDSKDNIIIIPESLTLWMPLLKEAKKIIWWMSVDNYINATNERDIDDIARCVSLHLYQSYYAKNYIERKIPNANGIIVSDYINEEHGKFINPPEKRKNIVLFNPQKGIDDLKIFIIENNWIKWIPLYKLSRMDMIAYMQISKIYIDFGNHPGKDRIPREAAVNGCCVITNKKGAAAFFEDVPIPEEYKFEDTKAQFNEISALMHDICDDFTTHQSKFEEYRSIIKGEKQRFIDEVVEFTKYVEHVL